MLRAGGNAFDAAVAGGFASAVAEPALTSLGGGGFLLARTPDGRDRVFDFFVDTPGLGHEGRELEPVLEAVTVRFPASDQVFHIGPGSVAVPANLRGFLHVHERLGRLPLAFVLAPAIALARDGVALNARQAYFLALLRPIKTASAEGRALYEPRGSYLAEGDTFRNPDLAAFLSELPASGDRDFYEGALAGRTARALADGGGLLNARDLAAYRVREVRPLAAPYRGRTLLTVPDPSFGGPLLATSLALLEAAPVGELGLGTAGHLATLAAVMQETEDQRASLGGDDAELEPARARVRRASGGTTHLSVADGEGGYASMTTSNGEGSGCFAPGTGIMLNNMMGEDDLHPDGFHASPPGIRVSSGMSPSLLLEDGSVELVLGSGGSKRIRTALLQVLSATVDFGLDVASAVNAPRAHWDGETLQLEPGFSEDAAAALSARVPTNVWPVLDVYFGGVNAVASDGSGAADPRRGGSAVSLG